MHPILDALDRTPHEWIKKLLFTFNEGNIGKFEALAPLFPKEVRLPTLFLPPYQTGSLTHTIHPADPPRKLRVPTAEDLLDGADRIGVQTERR